MNAFPANAYARYRSGQLIRTPAGLTFEFASAGRQARLALLAAFMALAGGCSDEALPKAPGNYLVDQEERVLVYSVGTSGHVTAIPATPVAGSTRPFSSVGLAYASVAGRYEVDAAGCGRLTFIVAHDGNAICSACVDAKANPGLAQCALGSVSNEAVWKVVTP